MLYKELEEQGTLLFRWRSYVPLIILPLAIYFELKSNSYGTPSELSGNSWAFICLSISMFGIILRALTVGFVPRNTSGRNTTEQVAAFLNTSGIYSTVRHPLYFANFIVFAGYILRFGSLEFFVISSLIYLIYYERIMMAEERFLSEKFEETYKIWAAKTPAFLPNISKWQTPNLSFSMRAVLRREPPTILLVGVVFFIIEFMEDTIIHKQELQHWVKADCFWSLLLVAFLILYIVTLVLKKTTNLLTIDGR